MENGLCPEKLEKSKNELGFFPHYFRKIGAILIAMLFITAIILGNLNSKFRENKEVFRIVFMNIFIIGLYFIAWSKDRFEDERSLYLRLKIMGSVIGFAIIMVLVRTFVDLVWQVSIKMVTAQDFVASLLFIYLIWYNVQKRFEK